MKITIITAIVIALTLFLAQCNIRMDIRKCSYIDAKMENTVTIIAILHVYGVYFMEGHDYVYNIFSKRIYKNIN